MCRNSQAAQNDAPQLRLVVADGHLFRRDGQAEQLAGHAWAEAWVPALGWVAFDPTRGVCADDAYARVAHGLDYSDAAPIGGVRRGDGEEIMSVEVRIGESSVRSQRQSQSQNQSRTQRRNPS